MRPDRPFVLVTGGGSGIGRAIAVAAAADGARIALCGRRLDALEETARQLDGTAEPLLIPADLTHPVDRDRVVGTLAAVAGRLDVLVNNAGVVEGGDHETASDAAVERMFATNVLAPMALTRALFPLLRAGREPRVVNVGSMFGDIAYPGFSAYSASKFALRGFSAALAREWRQHGIGVTYAAPRATRTLAAGAFDALIARTGMTLDAPDEVGRRIWAAARSGRRAIYPKGPERLFIMIQAFFPGLIDRAISPRRPAETA